MAMGEPLNRVENRAPLAKAKVLGVLLGLGIVGGALLGWRLLSDAAQMFAPALALLSLGLWALSQAAAFRRWPVALLSLKTASWVSLGLAAAAALSLGAFLPAG